MGRLAVPGALLGEEARRTLRVRARLLWSRRRRRRPRASWTRSGCRNWRVRGLGGWWRRACAALRGGCARIGRATVRACSVPWQPPATSCPRPTWAWCIDIARPEVARPILALDCWASNLGVVGDDAQGCEDSRNQPKRSQQRRSRGWRGCPRTRGYSAFILSKQPPLAEPLRSRAPWSCP